MGCGGMVLYGTQNLSQLGRAEFAGSAGPVAVPGETDFGHGVEVKRVHGLGPGRDVCTRLLKRVHTLSEDRGLCTRK